MSERFSLTHGLKQNVRLAWRSMAGKQSRKQKSCSTHGNATKRLCFEFGRFYWILSFVFLAKAFEGDIWGFLLVSEPPERFLFHRKAKIPVSWHFLLIREALENFNVFFEDYFWFLRLFGAFDSKKSIQIGLATPFQLFSTSSVHSLIQQRVPYLKAPQKLSSATAQQLESFFCSSLLKWKWNSFDFLLFFPSSSFSSSLCVEPESRKRMPSIRKVFPHRKKKFFVSFW